MTPELKLQALAATGCILGVTVTWLLFKLSKLSCLVFTCLFVIAATTEALTFTFTRILGINGGDVVNMFVMSYMTGLAVVLASLALDGMLRAHEPMPSRQPVRR